MPLSTLPGTVDNIWTVYRGQVDKAEVLSKHRYKETRILLINTIAEVEVKLRYVVTILMSIVSIVCF